MTEPLEAVYLNVAEAMKFLRLSAGLSQAAMADLLHVPTNTYRNYERATNRIPLHTLMDVAKYFNKNVNYFMDYGQEPEEMSNRIILELKDNDIVDALTGLEAMDQDNRKSVYDFIEFCKSKM